MTTQTTYISNTKAQTHHRVLALSREPRCQQHIAGRAAAGPRESHRAHGTVGLLGVSTTMPRRPWGGQGRRAHRAGKGKAASKYCTPEWPAHTFPNYSYTSTPHPFQTVKTPSHTTFQPCHRSTREPTCHHHGCEISLSCAPHYIDTISSDVPQYRCDINNFTVR